MLVSVGAVAVVAAGTANASSEGTTGGGGAAVARARHIATPTVNTPASRNSQAISRSVHAVVRAIAAKMLHSRMLVPSVRRVSLCAERVMMPITAAPIP